MLLCRSSGFERRVCRLRRSAAIAEDFAGDEALQATDDLRFRLPFARTPLDIVEARLVAAHAGDDDPVKGGVGLPIATAVEPVAGRLAARGGIGQTPHSFANAACERSAPDYLRRAAAASRPCPSRAPGPAWGHGRWSVPRDGCRGS